MHIGQGSNPKPCCRYKPKPSKATQQTDNQRKTRRGASFIHANNGVISGIYLLSNSSKALQLGEHTAWDLPKIFLETIWDRARCLPHKKHDMVAAPKDVAAVNGEPETLDL